MTPILKAYFVIIFAYQPIGVIRPAQTHVFALWVQVESKPDSIGVQISRPTITDRVIISWLPADPISPLEASLVPVLGRNLGLTETLSLAKGKSLASWTLECDEEMFQAAKSQREKLVLYKALDHNSRYEIGAVNCIHAVSDVVGPGVLRTGLASGHRAGQKVVDLFIASGHCKPTTQRFLLPIKP